MFQPNKKFRKEYDRIFQEDPEAANLFLLLAELSDEKAQVQTDPDELAKLLAARFNDPKEYAL
jgi:hypothetical protein